jgi:hypothetical protein
MCQVNRKLNAFNKLMNMQTYAGAWEPCWSNVLSAQGLELIARADKFRDEDAPLSLIVWLVPVPGIIPGWRIHR